MWQILPPLIQLLEPGCGDGGGQVPWDKAGQAGGALRRLPGGRPGRSLQVEPCSSRRLALLGLMACAQVS